MRFFYIPLTMLGLCGALLSPPVRAQSASSSSSQTQDPAPASSASPATNAPPATSADPKKPKKVWTNDDLGGVNGSVSVVGNSKNPGKAGSSAPDKPADAQYISNTKKELQKLRSQLDDTTKELTDLQNFEAGKAPASSGYPLNKGYNRVPVDQQISSLEAKKKDLEDKIDALLDEARKKGVQPGDLR
jgi:hypothetical protein